MRIKNKEGLRGRVREGILRGILRGNFCTFSSSDFEDASLYCNCCANIQSRKLFTRVAATEKDYSSSNLMLAGIVITLG